FGRLMSGDYRRWTSGTSAVNKGLLLGLLLTVLWRLGLGRGGAASKLPPLANTGLLADFAPQVIEPALADVAMAQHIDLVDARRVDEKRALDADAVGDAPHGEVLAQAAAGHADDGAFEHLDALASPLDDFGVHLDRVARPQRGHFLLLLLLLELLDDVHVFFNSLVCTEDLSAAWWRRQCLMRALSPERSTSGTVNPR